METTSDKRWQERPKHEEIIMKRYVEGLSEKLQHAILDSRCDELRKYVQEVFPRISLSEVLKFMCDNSDKKEIMIAKICEHYTSGESNTTELCVRKFCDAHAAYLLEMGNKPCILFKQ